MAPEVPSPDVDLRPLTTGELIDRGFGLYRKYFAGLLLIALLSEALPFLVQIASNAFHLTSTQDEALRDPVLALEHMGIFFVLAAIGQIALFCFTVAMTIYVSDAYLGKVPTFSRSFGGLGRHWLGAIASCLLNNIFYLIAFIFPLIALMVVEFWYLAATPATLGAFMVFALITGLLALLSLAPVLIVVMRLMTTVPVLAMEGLAGWSACVRSSALVRYDPGLGFFYWGETRLSLLLLPLFVIHLMISLVTSVPMILAQINDAVRHGAAQFATPSDAVVVGSQVLTYLSGAVILPLYVIAVVLFYYDVRIRREGFDLEFLSQRLETKK